MNVCKTMNWRLVSRLILASGTGLIIACATPTLAHSEPIEMRIALPNAEVDPVVVGLREFEREVEEALPGEIDVQIFPNSTLVSQSRLLPALQRGNVQAATFSIQRFADKAPLSALYGAAFLYRDVDHLCTITNGEFGQSVMAQVEEVYRIKALGTAFNGTRSVGLRERRDVSEPGDLAGLKLRTPGSQAWLAVGDALGGVPTPVQFSELYLAMQTGTVDGFEQTTGNVINLKLFEVSDQFVRTNHVYMTVTLWVSKAFWDKLSPTQQAVLNDAGSRYASVATNLSLEQEGSKLAEVTASGIEVTEVDQEAFRAFAREKYAESDLSVFWPEGIYDRLARLPAEPGCQFE